MTQEQLKETEKRAKEYANHQKGGDYINEDDYETFMFVATEQDRISRADERK